MIFETAEAALTFIHAGNSRITVVSDKTEKRFTFRIKASDDGQIHFVSVLYGASNETDYSYIGFVRDGNFIPSDKHIKKDDVRVKAFAWIYSNLRTGVIKEQLTIMHENRCGRCARPLTTPTSILSGYGPECINKIQCVGV